MPFLTRSVPHAGAARRAAQGAEGRDAFDGATREATLATFRFEPQLRVIARREMIAQPITGVILNVAWQEREKKYRLFLSQYVEPTTICFSSPEENVHPCKSHLPALQLVGLYSERFTSHCLEKQFFFQHSFLPFPSSLLPSSQGIIMQRIQQAANAAHLLICREGGEAEFSAALCLFIYCFRSWIEIITGYISERSCWYASQNCKPAFVEDAWQIHARDLPCLTKNDSQSVLR